MSIQERTSTEANLRIKQLTLILAFAGVYILWGSTYLAIKILVVSVPPFAMAAFRFLIAGGIMFALAALHKQPVPNKEQIVNAAVSGILLLVLGNGMLLLAYRYIASTGVIAVIVAITPLWTVLLQWLWKRNAKPVLAVWIGIALGIAGMWSLAGPKNIDSLGPSSWMGITIILAGTFSWAVGTIYASSKSLPSSGALNSGIQMLSASACMFVMTTLTNEWKDIHLSQYGWNEAFSFLYLILGGSVLGFTAYTYIARNASPSSVSTYAYVNPVIALLLGWWILHESISTQTLIACAVLIVSVVLVVAKPTLGRK